jgi:futalosine hydrolase
VILLVCAVARELSFWTPRRDVDVLEAGVGPVDAACRVSQALAQRRYRLVVNAGIAGAFDGGPKIGDGVVVIDDAIEVNLETGAPIPLPPGERAVEKVCSDLKFAPLLTHRGFAAVGGITVSRVTSSEATAQRLFALGARVESMEGFAVLRAAELAGVPAIEVRGISNRVGERSRSQWNFEAGQRGLQSILHALFEIVDVAEHPA